MSAGEDGEPRHPQGPRGAGGADRSRSAHGNPRRAEKEVVRYPRRNAHPLFPNAGGLPISVLPVSAGYEDKWCRGIDTADPGAVPGGSTTTPRFLMGARASDGAERSAEHTSELKSLIRSSYAVFCLQKK